MRGTYREAELVVGLEASNFSSAVASDTTLGLLAFWLRTV